MSRRRKIIFFVPTDVHVLDLTGPVQAFYEADTSGAAYDLRCSALENRLGSAGGFPLGEIRQFATVNPSPGDYVFVPGADMDYLRSASFKMQIGFLSWLRSMPERSVTLCSVCTGAFILAEAGLLNHVRCTTHWKRLDEFRLRYPLALAEEKISILKPGIFIPVPVSLPESIFP